jgi:hypothetical protein
MVIVANLSLTPKRRGAEVGRKLDDIQFQHMKKMEC